MRKLKFKTLKEIRKLKFASRVSGINENETFYLFKRKLTNATPALELRVNIKDDNTCTFAINSVPYKARYHYSTPKPIAANELTERIIDYILGEEIKSENDKFNLYSWR
jgi:hypothetical protein